MRTYDLVLQSEVSRSFRCQKAANSQDIDATKKALHRFSVTADLDAPYNIGLLVGASGSGKSTLAARIWGQQCMAQILEPGHPVIDQFPAHLSYDDCAALLNGVGLTSVPCWIRPAYTLSTGQRCRAEIALQMAQPAGDGPAVIDEWTSVVDRTVAKVMSHRIQKFARAEGRQIVLLSCHSDVVEWLNPDWIIDTNTQTFTDRRLLCPRFARTEQLHFEVREARRESWRHFSRYHYLSDGMASGRLLIYGLFQGWDQIGFHCYSNYVPQVPGQPMVMHVNRIVVHPDYCGFGLGLTMVNATAGLVAAMGYDVWCKFSSAPIYHAMQKCPHWVMKKMQRKLHRGSPGRKGYDNKRNRVDVKTYSFRYMPQQRTELCRTA